MVKIYPTELKSPIIYPVRQRTPGQNKICTSHYHAWSFVFVNLFEQFHRAANIFFLFSAILQAIPVISPLDPVMGFISVIFMCAISMVKVGYEDYQRHKADDIVNNREITLWQSSGPTKIKWQDVQPGDILLIENDQEFAADCVILETSSKDHRCRIQTAALDGEADLKYRYNVADDFELKQHDFLVEFSSPAPELTTFTGSIITASSSPYILSLRNFVPRGCFLRKTESVYALAIYTGENTKIIMNSSKPRYKYTILDRFMSKFVVVLFIVLLVISIIFSICSKVWGDSNYKHGYLQLERMSNWYYFWTVFSWILILNYFIPLCVYSCLDIVRFALSFTITYDNELMDGEQKSVCRNSDLVYSIGRITHVFSDKTGTLTKNQMSFKVAGFPNVVLGFTGNVYEEEEEDIFDDNDDELKDENKLDNIDKNDESDKTDEEKSELSKDSKKSNADIERLLSFSEDDINYIKQNIDEDDDIQFFIWIILFCNSALTSPNPNYYDIEEIHKDFPDFQFTQDLPPPEVVAKFPYSVTYLTGSPDELCLVHLARECGYIIYDITINTVQVIIDGELQEFERPVTFEFSSKRKRASCITKINGKYYMLMKGADSIVMELCNNKDSILFDYVQEVSECGLRTLVYAYKEIDDSVDTIIQRYAQAKMLPVGSDAAIEQLENDVENQLNVIALSGVEDELQDEVGLTLQRLRMANIKVWMLTGDKLSTALNIGKTTELISNDDQVIIITLEDTKNHFARLESIDPLKTVIVLEGATFASFLLDKEIITAFFDYSSKCSGVIIARCEPSQKGNAVRSFREYNIKNTILAIGDGANDVDMIRAADVGVGVEGKEGAEAVMSSDFSIPSYHHLARLLIVHGRWCVNRVSLLVLLTFYKNAMIGILQIFYGFFNGFSATSTFDSAFLTVYNIILTIPQLFFICFYEQDLTSKYALAVPHIYKECQQYGGLSAPSLAEFYVLSVFHSAMIFFFSFFESNSVFLNDDGLTFDYTIFTQITGWTLLFVFTITCITRFKTFTIIHIFLYIVCIFVYMLIELIYSYFNLMYYGVLDILFNSARVWFTIPFCVLSCLAIDFVIMALKPLISPSLSNAVAELEYAAGFGKIRIT